ncbi:hypothetical protein Pcinc_011739 [Petrolisthes cinctipes]|uniref:Uncharacterized protein n=1 Tax=Petrolisthes cinctipes TaxID=88211 RepID=A0AAE1KU53_PETCI|nr:hypothetical protein Pcinc_011739 [Petrolisthes cinctipes]
MFPVISLTSPQPPTLFHPPSLPHSLTITSSSYPPSLPPSLTISSSFTHHQPHLTHHPFTHSPTTSPHLTHHPFTHHPYLLHSPSLPHSLTIPSSFTHHQPHLTHHLYLLHSSPLLISPTISSLIHSPSLLISPTIPSSFTHHPFLIYSPSLPP